MTAKLCSIFLIFLLSGGNFVQSLRSEQKYGQMKVEVVDGFFKSWDKETEVLQISLDQEGKLTERISLNRINSVYLMQGKPEKLRKFLKSGSVGAAGVFGSKVLLIDKLQNNKNSEEKSFDWVGNGLWTLGGFTAGVLAEWLWAKVEEGVRPFPIYDPEIRTNTSGSGGNGNGGNGKVDYGDIKRLELLTPGVSFVRVTLKDITR